MPTTGQKIAEKAHEAHLKYLASLKPEEKAELERTENIGKIGVKPVGEGPMAQMLMSGRRERAVA